MDLDRFKFALEMLMNSSWDIGYACGIIDSPKNDTGDRVALELAGEAREAQKRYSEELLEMVWEETRG